MTARRMPWKPILIVWVLLLVLGAAGGAAFGYMTGPAPGPELPSPAQTAAISDLGQPPAFFVGDGPLTEGGEWRRIEVWLYPDDGVRLEFLDGVFAGEGVAAASAAPPAQYSPAEFGREQTRAGVEDLLGEVGEVLPAPDESWDGLEVVGYAKARLVVGYLDGRLYLVETF